MSSEKRDLHFNNWKHREALAESMIPMIGALYRERNVVTSVFGRPLVNRSVIAILKAHRFVKQVDEAGLSAVDTYPILKVLESLELGPSRIDIGKLAVNYRNSGSELNIEDYVKSELAGAIQSESNFKQQDVVLYGFGRIGRLLARILIEKAGGGDGLRLRAIVVRKGRAKNDIAKRASLLRRDSVHGSFQGTIAIDEEGSAIIANGNYIKVIYSDSPDSIDYTEHGINDALIVDNTGVWRDEESLSMHLKSKGAARVVLTAPGKGEIKNIVFGVNDHLITPEDRVLSAASCTTNAITPVLKALNDEYGVDSGHVETVHAYTNDQNLIDNYHPGDRRGRGAALNMVITETGAAKAVAKALPELEGKLTGNAIRVPTPNVSMAILNLTLNKNSTKEELNSFLRETALHSPLRKQIDYVNSPEVVSSDFVGSRHAAVVDSLATIVSDNRCVLYIWYDNEFGYSCQVVRMLEHIANITYPAFPD
ncbi:MAG: glyceraldehyde-3-phosphate dehydrogenase [Pseudomonadales bacterium]|nr:glyceraldehyde-3-phosphate dehydrogenase [Pseudomonadales bacterium]